MKSIRLFLIIICLLIPFNIFAGEWVQVEGWVYKLKVNPKILEDKLWEYINRTSDRNFKPKESYWYQYKAINVAEIYINALCRVNDPQSLSEDFVMVLDGGSCYFQATYNFRTNTIYDLQVNGEA